MGYKSVWNLNIIISFMLVLLIGVPVGFCQQGISAQEFGYRMEAHTLRVCTMMGSLLNDKKFLRKFPEYQGVNIAKFTSACTGHDITKRTSPTQARLDRENVKSEKINGRYSRREVRDYLASHYGVDKSLLDKNSKDFKKFEKIVEDLNYYDKKDMNSIMHGLKFTPEEQKLFLSLEESLDKTDRFMNCPKNQMCKEFGKKMESAEHWTQDSKVKAIANYYEKEVGHNQYLKLTSKLRFENYLQRRLANPRENFNDIRKEALSSYLDPNKEQIKKGLRLAEKSTRVAGSTLMTAAKPLVVLGPAMMAYDAYDAHANGGSAKDAALASLLMIDGKDICESSVCNTPNGMQTFFSRPLSEQTKTRYFDTDLNRVLNLNLPLVQNLRCDRRSIDGKIKITMIVIPDNDYLPKPQLVRTGEAAKELRPIDPDKLRTQEFIFSNAGEILSAVTSSTEDVVKLNLTFNNNKPDEIKSEGLSHPEFFDSSVEKFRKRFPTWKRPWFDSKANRRYRDISQLESQASLNGKAIYSCCNDKKCIEYFNPARTIKPVLGQESGLQAIKLIKIQ